jgi:acetoin utilization protein AcuB
MVVQDIMSQNPYSVGGGESLGDATRKLLEADVRHLPVIDEGSLVGMLSDRDIRGALPYDPADPRMAVPVTNVMSGDVISVTPETSVEELIDLMIEHKVGAIPVVEPDSAQLVGIVSYVDALRAARDLFSKE